MTAPWMVTCVHSLTAGLRPIAFELTEFHELGRGMRGGSGSSFIIGESTMHANRDSSALQSAEGIFCRRFLCVGNVSSSTRCLLSAVLSTRLQHGVELKPNRPENRKHSSSRILHNPRRLSCLCTSSPSPAEKSPPPSRNRANGAQAFRRL